MFSEIFSVKWHLTNIYGLFFYPPYTNKWILYTSQKTVNGTDEQCSSGVFRIIFWLRVFLLGRFRSIIYTWHFEVSSSLQKFPFLPMSRKGKSLCILSFLISRTLGHVINFDSFRKHGLCDLVHNIPNFPSAPKKVIMTSNPCQNVLTHDAGPAGQWPNYEGVCLVLCSLSPWVAV